MIQAEVKLDKSKSRDKAYFDKKLKQFTNAVKKCGVMEEVRLKRCFMKPSMRKKLAAQISANKWKFYS